MARARKCLRVVAAENPPPRWPISL